MATEEDEPGAPRVDHLNPAQREVLRTLGAKPADRPAFDEGLREHLRSDLEAALAPMAATIPDGESLLVSKRDLTGIHGCEGFYLADGAEDFAWTVARAVGTVAHKAIELSVHWRGDPVPGALVDEALARLIEGQNGLGDFLGGLREAERADLRSGAVERTTMFLECFPPLEARWRPVTESRQRADLCGDKIVLRGKVDLTVGQSHGLRAGKVLLDLKTGGFAPSHRDELRFYALLETLRLGTPPRLVASYYLDGGRLQPEPVSEPLLRSAVARVVDGVEAILALRREDRAPVLRPGPSCRWCPAREGCADGRRWLEQKADEEGW